MIILNGTDISLLLNKLIDSINKIGGRDFYDYLYLGLSILSLLAIWLTTAKQIKNQNKQLFRPYLDIEDFNLKSNEQKTGQKGILYFENYIKESKNNTISPANGTSCLVGLSMTIRNLGSGMARKIEMFNKSNHEKIIYSIEKRQGENSKYINKSNLRTSVFKEEIFKIYVEYIRDEESEISDKATIILYYEDINGNLYSMEILLKIFFNKDTRILNIEVIPFESKEEKNHFSYSLNFLLKVVRSRKK